MRDIKEISAVIGLKVKKLLEEKKELESRMNELENENKRLQAEITDQKNTITSLEEKNKIVKLAESLRDSGGNIQELKKKLNEYIHDIDECIRLLSDR